jgi:hypothetical protein
MTGKTTDPYNNCPPWVVWPEMSKRCCYITVDSVTTALQNGACMHISLHFQSNALYNNLFTQQMIIRFCYIYPILMVKRVDVLFLSPSEVGLISMWCSLTKNCYYIIMCQWNPLFYLARKKLAFANSLWENKTLSERTFPP